MESQANAHIQNILILPVISGSNPVKIYDFYEKLITNVQSLDTMGNQNWLTGMLDPP